MPETRNVHDAQTWTLVGTVVARSTALVPVIVASMTARFAAVEGRFDGVEGQFDGVEGRPDRVEATVAGRDRDARRSPGM